MVALETESAENEAMADCCDRNGFDNFTPHSKFQVRFLQSVLPYLNSRVLMKHLFGFLCHLSIQIKKRSRRNDVKVSSTSSAVVDMNSTTRLKVTKNNSTSSLGKEIL